MVTLVANDGVTKYVLTPSEVEKYSTIKNLLEIYPGTDLVLNLETVSKKTLRMLEQGPDPVMLGETYDLVSALYFLGADDNTMREWVAYLPIDYYTVLPEDFLLDLWKVREDNYPVPWDYYSSAGDARGYWEGIREIVEELLDAKVENKLYLAYLIDSRRGNMTARSYFENLELDYTPPKKISKSADELYSYQAEKLSGKSVYRGYYELFALLRQDADSYKLLPASLFTRTPEQLGDSLVDMTQHYINREVLLIRPLPVLQRFLRMWTLARELEPERDLSFEGDVVFYDDLKLSTAVSAYYEELLEVLLGIPLMEWLATIFDMEDEEDELIVEATAELMEKLKTRGEALLGGANTEFLVQALPELLPLSVSAAIQESHMDAFY